ncbi:MAG: universal stress protein, partial [Flavobacteriales bacterium]|nr:universal stress protein [Flavobacteriales bacterium]
MKNILVPTDFSDCANNATEVAVSIARKTGAKLHLMHIINMPTYESNTSIETYHDTAEALFIMKHVRKKFAALMSLPLFEGLEVEEVVDFNTVYEAISAHATERNADMIIMGSHGASGTQEFLVGS